MKTTHLSLLAASGAVLLLAIAACADTTIKGPETTAGGGGSAPTTTQTTGGSGGVEGGAGGIGGAGGTGGMGGTGGSAEACPTHLRFEAIGQDMRADVGWNGLSHGAKFPRGTGFTVETFDCDDECRRCRIRGPVADNPELDVINRQRCVGSVDQECTQDSDCAGNECRFIYSPMLNGDEGFTCLMFYFENDEPGPEPSAIQGVFDLLTGEADLNRFNLQLALSFFGLCDQCENDPTPFDGQKGGTCISDNNIACDIHAVSNDSSNPFTTSYDCPYVISGTPLSWPVQVGSPTHNLATSTVVWNMDTTRPSCTHTDFSGERCWCGKCSDTGLPCSRENDCPAPGVCNAGDGPPTRPHNCPTGQTCNWDPTTQTGTCSGGNLSCFTNSEQVTAEGNNQKFDGFYVSRMAGISCNPATGVSSTDSTVGLPGLVVVTTPYRVEPGFW